jgi:hypothetical protein
MAFRLTGEGFNAPHYAIARGDGAADDKNRIVPAHCSEDVRPGLTVKRRGDRLRAARHRAQDQHLASSVDAEIELREKSFERDTALLDTAVRDRVPCPLGGRNAGEPQLAQITGERRLCHVPTALEQQLAKIFLAADSAVANDLEYGVVPFPLVRHRESIVGVVSVYPSSDARATAGKHRRAPPPVQRAGNCRSSYVILCISYA